MKYLLLGAPLALAACGSIPCPVPVSCIEPDWCVCITTGTPAGVSDDGGAAPQFSAPDHNGGPTQDDHGPSDDHNGGDSGSSDENGGKS